MAAIQKCLGLRGAAKVMEFFCYCCSLRSADIVDPNVGDKICTECKLKQDQDSNWACYHTPFCSHEQQAKYEKALEKLKESWLTDMEEVGKRGKLKLNGSQYKNSIDYVPVDVPEGLAFMNLLVTEMEIRQKVTAGKTIHQMCAEVRENLLAEKEMSVLIKQISQAETRVQAMDHIMKYVPCVLHCENRMGLKILTVLLEEGLSLAQGNLFLPGSEGTTIKERE